MSTADSQLLAAASGISQNLVRECMGVKLSEKAALIVARITVVIISIVAVFMVKATLTVQYLKSYHLHGLVLVQHLVL